MPEITTIKPMQETLRVICQNAGTMLPADTSLMLEKLRALFRKWTRSVDDDYIVTLVQVALEDESLGDHLAVLLALPHLDRVNRLRTWQRDLMAEGAPEPLLQILSRLEDETLANQTYLILQKARNARSAK